MSSLCLAMATEDPTWSTGGGGSGRILLLTLHCEDNMSLKPFKKFVFFSLRFFFVCFSFSPLPHLLHGGGALNVSSASLEFDFRSPGPSL